MALAVQSKEVHNVASLIKMFQVLNKFLRILNPITKQKYQNIKQPFMSGCQIIVNDRVHTGLKST